MLAKIASIKSTGIIIPHSWDYLPVRESEFSSDKLYEAIFPKSWTGREYNVLLIDPHTGNVCAIAECDIILQSSKEKL